MNEVFGVPVVTLFWLLGIATFGFATHVIIKVGELRDADNSITLTGYLGRNPYKTIGKLMTVIGVVVGLAEPQITPLLAAGVFGIGYAADSAGNRIGR